jgi:rSAM/selenodomain-associated transferase 1
MKNKNLLILFTRNPELGKVKSRLAKSIGEEKALAVYKDLLEHTRRISTNLNVDKRRYYSVGISTEDNWGTSVYDKKVQIGNDLGEKMYNAFKEGFTSGYEKVILIGSDIIDLQESHIEHAFEALENFDTVIGPAEDGGYYLLGTKTLIPSVFKNKDWGTESVLKDTINDLDSKYAISFLEELNDIDVISDIKPDSYLSKHL